jgi:dTDP-glucose 4,6-dehydratase
MKILLITGAAGFIGSAFVRYMVEKYPDYNIIVYDKMTYAGNMDNLLSVDDEGNYHFEQGDIAARETVKSILQKYDVDTIVNFAAESHVDRSILDPDAFIHTDVVGAYIMLDEGHKHGIERFLQVSTDEVYGDIESGLSVEDDRFLPNSPYAASKAGGELMVRSYQITHGMDTVITRGSNTFGPYQYPEKLIPLFITEALEDRPLPVYGDGMQIRDWLHVDDHVTGIDLALHKGVSGEAYNIAGENEQHNINVIKLMLKYLDKPQSLIKYVPDREGHDRRYAMNSDKLRALGWKRQYEPDNFDKSIEATVKWYVENEWWWSKIKTGEYLEYYKQQYEKRLSAADSD